MPKFSTIARGVRAEKVAELPPPDGGDGTGVPALVRALNGLEEERVLVAARARAIIGGVEKPELGEPVYDLAVMVEAIAAAYLDPDSPKDDRQPMFSDGDEVRGAYGREAIAYMYELQKSWQDEVSPTIAKLDAKGYVDAIAKLASGERDEALVFFYRLEPGIRASLALTMASQLWSSLTDNSESGSTSAPSGTTSKSEAAS